MFWVRWAKKAIDEITVAWTNADSSTRQAITNASNVIDEHLRTSPLTDSESRAGGRRILFARSLGALFRVEADGVTVSVLHVWLFRTKPKS